MATSFEYCLIQYVGDPVRREAVNVGVIVVDAAAQQSAVVIDRRAPARLYGNWPNFRGRSFRAFASDLRHATGATHQLLLGEGATVLEASGVALSAIAEACSNEYALSGPYRYNGMSLQEVSGNLFHRFVSIRPRERSRSRHMTRAGLRDMMSDIFTSWALASAGNVVIDTDASVDGMITSHAVDLVAFRAGVPEHLLFATPLIGPQAALIRDSVPTVVSDLRANFPDAKFYAVLPEIPSADSVQIAAAATARAMLAKVAGLQVIGLEDLGATFPAHPALEPIMR